MAAVSRWGKNFKLTTSFVSIKPNGYVRYGDDFVLFLDLREQAAFIKQIITRWIANQLSLTVHPKNNVIIQTTGGLYFLGHQIYASSGTIINKNMTSKIERNVNVNNIGTYRAMHLSK